jgi:ketosteroid isomerase-like protein
MNREERAAVEKAMMDWTAEWLATNRRCDAEGMLNLFDDSDDLRHVENGVIFTYAPLADFVRGWYETTADMGLVLEESRVFPLAPEAATMTGIFRYEAKQRSGEVWAGRNAFTFVITKRGDAWKVIHGHESTIPPPESE